MTTKITSGAALTRGERYFVNDLYGAHLGEDQSKLMIVACISPAGTGGESFARGRQVLFTPANGRGIGFTLYDFDGFRGFVIVPEFDKPTGRCAHGVLLSHMGCEDCIAAE